MAKRPTVKEMYSAVEKRYGKTTGASKGKHNKPKPKTRVRPRGSLKDGVTGVRAQTTIRF